MESEFKQKMDMFFKEKEDSWKVNFPKQQPMSEVVKQISLLATSLHNFEKENVAKIEKNQREVETLNDSSN